MKISKFVNEVLIRDNVDQEEKYLVTTTRTLDTRIIDRDSWNRARGGEISSLPPRIVEDLERCHILVPSHAEELASFAGTGEGTRTLEREIDLSMGPGPAAPQLLRELEESGSDLLSVRWVGVDDCQALTRFRQLAGDLVRATKEKEKFLRGGLSSARPLVLPPFQQLQEEFYITGLEIMVDSSNADLASGDWEILAERIRKEAFSLHCQVNVLVHFDQLERVGPVLKKISSLNLQDHVSANFILMERGEGERPLGLDEKRQYGEREIDFLVELYHQGLPLPPLKPAALFKNDQAMGKNTAPAVTAGNCFNCHQCEILPACGGHFYAWDNDTVPCPSLKFNLKEKVLLKFLFQGPKCVDLEANI